MEFPGISIRIYENLLYSSISNIVEIWDNRLDKTSWDKNAETLIWWWKPQQKRISSTEGRIVNETVQEVVHQSFY